MVSAFENRVPPVLMDVELKHFKAMGVKPDEVDDVSAVIPNYIESVGDDRVGPQDNRASAASDGPATADPPASSGQVCDDGAGALRRLESLAQPTSAGFVTHKYSPEIILAALQLNRNLKPDTEIYSVSHSNVANQLAPIRRHTHIVQAATWLIVLT